MTREDIEIQACLYEDGCHNPSVQQHFIDGATWAKKELIDKACEWLKNSFEGGGYVQDWQIEEFRKIMEE